MKVTILQGIPGSGKSTLIPVDRKIRIVSADHYFVGGDGHYRFDPHKLPDAHGACLRSFARYSAKPDADELVVDNTNTTVAEVAPYYALAQAYGHEVRIVHLDCEPEVGAARNLHGVGLEACRSMAARIWKFRETSPLWWTRVTVNAEFDWDKSGWD